VVRQTSSAARIPIADFTHQQERATNWSNERKKERKEFGSERASSREQGRGFSSPHASDPLKLPSCEHNGATAMLSLSLSLSLCLPTFLNTYLPDYLPAYPPAYYPT